MLHHWLHASRDLIFPLYYSQSYGYNNDETFASIFSLISTWLPLWEAWSSSSKLHNILDNRPLISLLNSIVAGLGSPGLISVDLICKQSHVYIFITIKVFLHSSFYEFYACIHLSIVLAVVWQLYTMMDFQHCANSCNFCQTKFIPASDIIFFGHPYSAHTILQLLSSHQLIIPHFAWLLGTCYGNLIYVIFFFLSINMSTPTVSHDLPGI